MREEIYSSIKVLLQNDNTVAADHRQCILQVCRSAKTQANKGFCSPAEAAKTLGCHLKTLYRYAKKGLLHPVHHSARKVRFDRSEVEDFAIHGIQKISVTTKGYIPPSCRAMDE